MIIDDQTGERIDGEPAEIFERLAVHFGSRVAKATPDIAVSDAAAIGARLGMSFLASLMEGALEQRQPALFASLMAHALSQRDVWNLGDMCAVQFVNMTPRPGEQAN